MVLDCSVSDEILTFSSDTEICIPRFFVSREHHISHMQKIVPIQTVINHKIRPDRNVKTLRKIVQ